jgi:hypothetical protein
MGHGGGVSQKRVCGGRIGAWQTRRSQNGELIVSEIFKYRAFEWPPNDPLAGEHEVVSAWVEQAVEALGPGRYFVDVDLKSLSAGQTILSSSPEEARRYVAAAAAQALHVYTLS